MAIAWYYMFNYDLGVFNWLLSQLGISGVKWLTSSSGVIVAICLFSLWKFVGTPFLYYLIGLQGIPDGYYEAAQIDGANKIQTFFHITLPMLTPTLFFVITITTINTFQIFDEPYIITNGGPGNASRTLALHVLSLIHICRRNRRGFKQYGSARSGQQQNMVRSGDFKCRL